MGAVISECGTYRYSLTRRIPQALRWVKPCLFVMLNPSTADAELDDPTIRRCVGFAQSWGCTELEVVNLFALRSTDPKALNKHADPVGPKNDEYTLEAIQRARHGVIVAAWGAHKFPKVGYQAEQFRYLLQVGGYAKAQCLGMNADRSPKHPLYLKSDSQLIEFK